jgi:hypothetical protein
MLNDRCAEPLHTHAFRLQVLERFIELGTERVKLR